MLEHSGVALPLVVFYTESKVGKTGLTVTVDVWRWNGTTWTEVVTGGSATEIGDGSYYYNLASASNTVEGLILAIFKTSTTTVDQQHIPSMWCISKAGVEFLDAAISSRAAAGAIVTVQNPVAQNKTVSVFAGSDYDADHTTELSWTNTTWTWTPTPTEVRLVVHLNDQTAPILSVVGSAPSSTSLRVELTAANLNLDPGNYRYQVQVTRSDGMKEVPVEGEFNIKPRYAAA